MRGPLRSAWAEKRGVGVRSNRRDQRGRLPADWSQREGPAPGPAPEGWATGVRTLDLFAPLRRGCRQRWPAAYGLGQLAMLVEVALSLAPAATCSRRPVSPGRSAWFPGAADPAEARARFAATVGEVLRSRDESILVLCLETPGHTHDVTLALPRLARPPNVAIDPRTTISTDHPNERHARLAAEARATLAWYAAEDAELTLPDPASCSDPARAATAQRLLRLLAHPLVMVSLPFTSRPGERTGWSELLDAVEAIVQS